MRPAFCATTDQDEGPLYTADEVAEVFAAVMRRQSTKRR